MKNTEGAEAGYFDPKACDLEEFAALIDRATEPREVPQATEIAKNVPIYDVAALGSALDEPRARRELMAEWARVLRSGAGVLVLRGACPDRAALEGAARVFEAIIAEEKAANEGGADHFAAAGSNDRVWNALQKLCERAPDLHLRCFASPGIAAVCEAWLGPGYQMTAQVNLVYPGGAPQEAHRDFHLGFQTAAVAATYPAHVHDLSPVLTLQGAVAHCDIPLGSGPTKLLPFSQTYRPGYVAWRRDDFRALFEERYVQVPLATGDALFFNPALFHAAGANVSADIRRMANLLQVSSAFGRAMESVDRTAMCKRLYPHALAAHRAGDPGRLALKAAIAATAEGYAFPTNLDRDPPSGGLAPESQQAFFLRALEEAMSEDVFAAHLDAMVAKQRADTISG